MDQYRLYSLQNFGGTPNRPTFGRESAQGGHPTVIANVRIANGADIKIVDVLKNNPDIRFSIQGHTDSSGNAAHNLTLSQQRADGVKQQLVELGVDASRLGTNIGASRP